MSSNIIIKDCFKTYTLDQDKAFSPEETVARVNQRLAEARINVLERTERIDNGRLDIPVHISVLGTDALEVMPTKKQMGKGATPAQSEASAVMELVERFSFYHFLHNERFISGTYDEIGEKAMPFEHLAAAVHHDPDDFDRARQAMKGLELSWTPAFNLTRGREYLVPFNWFFEINEFNGPAAGNSMEEALVQGMSELVERHVSALVCRGRLDVPFIDAASLESPIARELVEKFEGQGIKLYVKDFTLDMGVPTVGALAYDPETFPALSEIVYTAGTAPDPEKAYMRTLTEVAQLAGDFNTAATFVASGLPKYTDLSQASYITRSAPSIPISALPNISHTNIKVEAESIVSALAERGFEVYVINTTHPDIDIPAIYTIVPGAHFRERARASSVPFFAAKIISGRNNLRAILAGLEGLRKLYPDKYYLDFFQAQALLEAGQVEAAVPLLNRALDSNPNEQDVPGILTYLGLAHKDLENYDQAIELLSRSTELDDERRDTFNLLGFCYFKTKRHEKAVQAFEKVLRIDPGSGIDHANIGTNYREMGRTEEAVRYYKTALRLDPTLDWVRDNIAKLTG
jgi:ribosomal protein S12 methylthiotransferase accessory factor